MSYILVLNAGSSSLKYQLIDMADESVAAKGLVERIGIDGSVIKHSPAGKAKFELVTPMKNHADAISQMIAALTDKDHGVISDMKEIGAVGHRIVHGAEEYYEPLMMDEKALAGIAKYNELAPLHNPANIVGVETCMKLMPGIPNVGVFDTAFHHTMEPKAFMYALPYEVYEKFMVRKYGFHGTSHSYISKRVAELLGRKDLRIITCHLGNGSSIAAVKDGKCVDTTMGLTPLEGLAMGTRCGDVDASVVTFLMSKYGISAEEVLTIFNKKSGVLGISGVSSDFRDLENAANEGNKRAQLALDMFIYRIRKYIGAYAAAMGGVDVIAFAGGIGENDLAVRGECVSGLEFLGVKLDPSKNTKRGEEMVISTDDSAVKIMVVPTNEELMIARETADMIK